MVRWICTARTGKAADRLCRDSGKRGLRRGGGRKRRRPDCHHCHVNGAVEMNHKLQRVVTGARELESRLTEAFEQAAQTIARPRSSQPLELISLACDDIARNVHPAGRGRYAFPFNRVTVTFPAPTTEHQ